MKMMKKEWKIPVCWEMCSMVTVQAATLEEAFQYVKDNLDDIPLPIGAYYTDGSFGPSMEDIEEIREVYNGGQKDF